MELINLSLINDANLMGYYRMETGALTTDSSGEGRTLTNNNTVGEDASGKYGYTADFGTTNSNKTLSRADNMNVTGNGSISMWVKCRTEIGSGAQTLCAISDGTNDQVLYIDYAYNGGTRRLEFHRSKVGVADVSSNYTITLGTDLWYHLVLSYDGSNITGYINGVATTPQASSGNGTAPASTSFTIGGGVNTVASFYIDDVAIFNKALSEAEAQTIFADSSARVIFVD